MGAVVPETNKNDNNTYIKCTSSHVVDVHYVNYTYYKSGYVTPHKQCFTLW